MHRYDKLFRAFLFANGDSGARWFTLEELRLVDTGIDNDIEKSDHHLFPTLLAIANVRRGIGIAGIVGRVVEVPNPSQMRARSEEPGRSQTIVELPLKIVVIYFQQRLHMTVRFGNQILECFP